MACMLGEYCREIISENDDGVKSGGELSNKAGNNGSL